MPCRLDDDKLCVISRERRQGRHLGRKLRLGPRAIVRIDLRGTVHHANEIASKSSIAIEESEKGGVGDTYAHQTRVINAIVNLRIAKPPGWGEPEIGMLVRLYDALRDENDRTSTLHKAFTGNKSRERSGCP